MKKKVGFMTIISIALLMSGCQKAGTGTITETQTFDSDTAISEVSETTTTEPVWQPSADEQRVARFLKNYLSDPEEFPDKENYQYYARAIGQDKDYFLNPEMWELFYNKEIINRNRDISGVDIYFIRLNPYKLLEIFSENNNCTVDEMCKKMSVSKEQLYYNWGYDPASVNYFEKHKKNEVTYSIPEQMIFGIFNNEQRDVVMRTHLIVYDHNEDTVTYQSEMYETHEIYRRDLLKNFSTEAKLYSEFSDDEKNPAFKLNGIGIRSVIPITFPNAFKNAVETGLGDENVSVMINTSPFSYGCTDNDKLDLDAIYKYMDENS